MNWEVTNVVNGVDTPINCDTVGAVAVTAQLTGYSSQIPGYSDRVACPAGSSTGAPLLLQPDQAGSYSVDVQLRDANDRVLSQTGPNGTPSKYVDCSGTAQTPVISLSVN